MSELHFPVRVWERTPHGWRSRSLEPILGERMDVMAKELMRREGLRKWWADYENPPTDLQPVTLRFVAEALGTAFP